jgi:hypothetical protein
MQRVRVYESALADVHYVYGAPLAFDPALANGRRSMWAEAVQDFERRQKAAG